MDLAKFAQLPPEENNNYLKFKAKDNIKIVRFLYRTASEIQARQKLYDPQQRKVIWDTPEGKWTIQLKVAVYSDKDTFEIMTWDRSAAFGRDILLPQFEEVEGDICDQVYKIKCAKAGTIDASYTIVPVKDSDTYAMPDIPDYKKGDEDDSDDDEEDVDDDDLDEDDDEDIDDDEDDEEDEPPKKTSKPAPKAASAPKPSKQDTKAASSVPEKKKKRNFWDED